VTFEAQGFGPSGYTNLPTKLVFEDRTGYVGNLAQVQALCGAQATSPKGWLSAGQGQVPLVIGAMLGALVAHGDTTTNPTGYAPPIQIEAPAFAVVATAPPGVAGTSLIVRLRRGARRTISTRSTTPPPLSAAEELRTISGLAPGKLADFFGVSRTTYYKWITGATPRDSRFQQLVDVLAHTKDAQRKLPPSIELSAWLRTPISPGGRSPLDLLRERRFSTFRGLLVRATSEEMVLSSPLPSIVAAPLSREELVVARERINPSLRADPEDPPEGEGSG
jgi:hypothetical protein